MSRTALSISMLLILALFVALFMGVSNQNVSIDYELLGSNSLLIGKKGHELPTIIDAVNHFKLDFYSEVTEETGLSAVQGPIEMKPCCIPGSTGAYEHVLQLVLLKGSSDRLEVFRGLELSISGYCSIADASQDIASTVIKAEGMFRTPIDEAALEDAIIKVLAVAHHRWYTGTDKGPKYYSMDLEGMLGFTLKIDPELLEIALLWPAHIAGIMPMSNALSEYDSIAEADKLGIETILKADFNALALERQEASTEEASCVTTDTGST